MAPNTLDVVPKQNTVRVNIVESQTLADCLQRATDTQKRTIDSMNFYARQMEDERKVFTEARDVIGRIIARAHMDRAT